MITTVVESEIGKENKKEVFVCCSTAAGYSTRPPWGRVLKRENDCPIFIFFFSSFARLERLQVKSGTRVLYTAMMISERKCLSSDGILRCKKATSFVGGDRPLRLRVTDSSFVDTLKKKNSVEAFNWFVMSSATDFLFQGESLKCWKMFLLLIGRLGRCLASFSFLSSAFCVSTT